MVVVSVNLPTKLLMVERVVMVFNVTMDVVTFCTHVTRSDFIWCFLYRLLFSVPKVKIPQTNDSLNDLVFLLFFLMLVY